MKVDKDINASAMARKIVNALMQSGCGYCGDRLAIKKTVNGVERDLGGHGVASAVATVTNIVRTELRTERRKSDKR